MNELEFKSELDFEAAGLDFEEEWMEEETLKELEQARGEKLIDTKKKRRNKSNNTDEIILVFEDTDNLDEEETYSISIKANSIKIVKTEEKGKLKKVGISQLKENKFLEYITNQDYETMTPQLTMAFENGYSIEISGSKTIEEI
jgi:hypothetical protein